MVLKQKKTDMQVSAGLDCTCAQEVAAMNSVDKHCCALGKLISKRIVVTPDTDSMLDSVIDLD